MSALYTGITETMNGYLVATLIVLLLIIAVLYTIMIRPIYRFAGNVDVKITFADKNQKDISVFTQQHVEAGSQFTATVPLDTEFISCSIYPIDSNGLYWSNWHAYDNQKNVTIKYGTDGATIVGALDLLDRTAIGPDRIVDFTLAQY